MPKAKAAAMKALEIDDITKGQLADVELLSVVKCRGDDSVRADGETGVISAREAILRC
jgi:hypothetical protein